MTSSASASSLTFAEYVRTFSDQKQIRKISALFAQLFLFCTLAIGALNTFLSPSSQQFIFAVLIGSMGSFGAYWVFRFAAIALRRRKLRAVYLKFLSELNESNRPVAVNCFSNLINLGFALEKQSRFLMNIVSESFEYSKDSLLQMITISRSGKILLEKPSDSLALQNFGLPSAEHALMAPAGDPNFALLLEEATVAIERMYILLQAGLYDDEPLRSIVVQDVKKRLSEAENFAVFMEKLLLFEKEIVADLKETVQFCLNVIGLSEAQSSVHIQRFLKEREERRKKLHESFYEFMLSIPKAPIDFSNS